MTVNIPSSCSAADDEEIAAGASEATGVEAKECAIGPAEPVHAKARRIEKRAKSISASGPSLELSNEREDARRTRELKKRKQWIKRRYKQTQELTKEYFERSTWQSRSRVGNSQR